VKLFVSIIFFLKSLNFWQVATAKQITYGMPNGDVPVIFQAEVESDETDSDVEIIEDDRPTKRRVVHDLC
jgi:hypothetical protein